MRSCFTPKSLVLAGVLTWAALVWAVPARAQDAGTDTSGNGGGDQSQPTDQSGGGGSSKSSKEPGEVAGVFQLSNFNCAQAGPDNSTYKGMLIKMDLQARANPDTTAVNPKWLENVEVTLTVGWGSKSADAPKIDQALTATAKLVGVEVNSRTTVAFYIAPEFFQIQSALNINLSTEPSFWVVSIKVGDIPIQPSRSTVSSSLSGGRVWVDGFLSAAGNLAGKNAGIMVPIYDAPGSVYDQLSQSGGSMPTYIRPANAGGAQ
jgi:hypothetical protein